MSDEIIRMSELFDSLPIHTPIILQLSFCQDRIDKSVEGYIDQKFRHSVYSYSVFFNSLNGRYGGYYWIKPKWELPKCLRIVGFENVE